jgi:hypothetical protein
MHRSDSERWAVVAREARIAALQAHYECVVITTCWNRLRRLREWTGNPRAKVPVEFQRETVRLAVICAEESGNDPEAILDVLERRIKDYEAQFSVPYNDRRDYERVWEDRICEPPRHDEDD